MPSRPFVALGIACRPTADDMGFRPVTIRARATIAAATVVGAALVLAGVFLVVTLHHRLVQGQRNTAQLRGRDVGALAASGRLPATLSIPGEGRALIQVVNRAGKVVSRSDNITGETPILPSDLRNRRSWSGVRRGLPIGDGEAFIVVSRIYPAPGGELSVITAESLESAREDAASLARLLIAGLPLFVGLVALVTRRVVKTALQPVGAMNAQLAEITSNRLHRRVTQPATDDEIAELASTMNTMLDRIQVASDRQRSFVADASHELRSPLTSVRAALEVAEAHPNTVDPHVAIRDALADHDRLDALVADLLTLARLDESVSTEVGAPVDLALLVGADIESRTEPTVNWSLDLQPAVVTGSERQLQRVVRNLVDNAVRHADSGVVVSTGVSGRDVVLRVSDDGVGIADEHRDRVFERFARIDTARSVDDGGTGLGLAIVRVTVQAHGGSIGLIDGPSSGAVFEVRLPAATVPVSYGQQGKRPRIGRSRRAHGSPTVQAEPTADQHRHDASTTVPDDASG